MKLTVAASVNVAYFEDGLVAADILNIVGIWKT
jgi:hypothetical protein